MYRIEHAIAEAARCGLKLNPSDQGLTLEGDGMLLRADFHDMVPRMAPGRLSRELLVRAAKVKKGEGPLLAVDATAGLGEDSLLLAAAGFQVKMFERNPVIAALLQDALPEADLVAALDDNSLTAAGECSASNNLHGAVVYGIGNSTEAVYYLDTGSVECLVVPDEFNVGYQSLTEMAGRLKNPFRGLKDRKVSGTVIRREELFTEENQDILFTMSQ